MKKLIYKQRGLQNIQNYKTICYISISITKRMSLYVLLKFQRNPLFLSLITNLQIESPLAAL
jgi:hypothetical protein